MLNDGKANLNKYIDWCNNSFIKQSKGENLIIKKVYCIPTSLHNVYASMYLYAKIQI